MRAVVRTLLVLSACLISAPLLAQISDSREALFAKHSCPLSDLLRQVFEAPSAYQQRDRYLVLSPHERPADYVQCMFGESQQALLRGVFRLLRRAGQQTAHSFSVRRDEGCAEEARIRDRQRREEFFLRTRFCRYAGFRRDRDHDAFRDARRVWRAGRYDFLHARAFCEEGHGEV